MKTHDITEYPTNSDRRRDPPLVRRRGRWRRAPAAVRGDGAAAEGGAGGVEEVPPSGDRRDLHGRRTVLREAGSCWLTQ